MITWLDHVEKWKDCQRCPLAQQRSNIVLARGTVPCDVLFIGEAPGASEDALGLPFVGPAGHLLNQIIERVLPQPTADIWEKLRLPDSTPWSIAIDKAKDESLVPMETVWVSHAMTNLVACFPANAKRRGDNEPEEHEIVKCRPRLEEFIAIARPRLVVLVGSLASNFAPQYDAFGRIAGARTLDIVHPASIVRMPVAQKQMAVNRCIAQLRSEWCCTRPA